MIGPLPSRDPGAPESTSEFIVAGFHAHGMAQCFGAGRLIAQVVTGQLSNADMIAPFRSDRFTTAGEAEIKNYV